MATTTVIATTDQESVSAKIGFVVPGSSVFRRYVCAGEEVNTAKFEPKQVKIYDARPNQSEYNLSNCAFQLEHHESKMVNWYDHEELNQKYLREIEQHVAQVTGADKVIAFNVVVRGITAKAGGLVQPPATEAHCDYNTSTSYALAKRALEQTDQSDYKFSHFNCINVWRAISLPPQDWPLAVCQAKTADQSENFLNVLCTVDKLPDITDLDKLEPLDDTYRSQAILYEYQPEQRWNFFSNMNAKETLLFKLFDSRNHELRCPHSSFDYTNVPGGVPRESVEVRTVAYFK